MMIVTAAISLLAGLFLLVGGIYLAMLGGSFYYLIAGLVFVITAVLVYL